MKPYLPPPVHAPTNKLLKRIAGLQLVIAIGGMLFSQTSWPTASAMIALTLAMILFSREQVHDERVEQLKLRAISYGVYFSLLVIVGFRLVGKTLLRDSPLPALAAMDSLILVQLVALALYHYWRWQDGREAGGRKDNAVNH